ncbi:MAG: BlaI/MecI/CopY family transcriptional regulator, partial [Rhodanobacteraceae bacterium]
MPKTSPAISEAESRVMEFLWERAPQASEDLAAALHGGTGWHENTVRTLLNRLARKGAVRAQRDGRRYLYSPVLTRDQWQTQESRSLLDRVFGGKV